MARLARQAASVGVGKTMSFRRKGKKLNAWRDWIEKHADALAGCGLPEVVYKDAVAWENFLADGFLPDGCGAWSGWKVEMLSADQARRLYDFLDGECAGHPFQRSMMNLLRRLLQQGTRLGQGRREGESDARPRPRQLGVRPGG